MPARSPLLRWLCFGVFVVCALGVSAWGQLQPRPSDPNPEPSPGNPPSAAAPADSSAASRPATGANPPKADVREPAAAGTPASSAPAANSNAATATAAPTVPGPNIADIVRSEIDRNQRERSAEMQSTLKAAQRANEELATRLGRMEESLIKQREQDSTYLRSFTRLSLTIAGSLTGLAILALGVIIWLQTRAARQQSEALAAHAEAIASLPQLLPGPGHSAHAHPTITSAQDRFHTAVDRVKQQLDEIESLAQAAAATPAPVPVAPSPAIKPDSALTATEELSLVPDPPAAEPTPAREDVATLLQKGHALIQEGQAGPALAYLERATVLDPGNVHAWLKRGVALEKLQRLRDALLAYDTAAAIDPSLPVVHLSRAGVLNRLQRYDDALRCYEQALAVQGREGDPSAAVA